MKTILNFFNDSTKYADHSVHVGMVRVGMVVQDTTFREGYPTEREPDDRFGHIVGFARNTSNELIVEVKWENGYTGPIHPSQVKLFC